MSRFSIVLLVTCLVLIGNRQVEADFSQRYMHAVDQLFRTVLSTVFQGDFADNGMAKRQEIGAQLFQVYNGFMASGMLDLTTLKLPSLQCLSDLVALVNAARSSAPPQWALRFADAIFKPPAGLLDGNLNWLGAFDECVRIQVNEPDLKTTGKYCLVPIYMDNSSSSALKDAVPGSTEGLNLGICVPSSCGNADIANLVMMVNRIIHSNSYFNTTGFNLFTLPQKMRCHDPDLPLSPYFITAITVVGIIIGLNLISTIYDVVGRYWDCNFQYAPMEPGTPPNSQPISPINVITPSALTAEPDAVRNRHGNYGPSMTPLHGNASSASLNNDSPPTLTTFSQPTLWTWKKTSRDDFLLSFSVIKNGEKLLNTSPSISSKAPISFGAIHGIRLISLLWVILGHTFLLPMGTVDNTMSVLNYTRRFEFQIVNQGFLAVDSFFVLSGFLLGYVALRQMDKFALVLRRYSPPLDKKSRTGRWFGFFGCFYLHRYLRLTPLLAFVLIAYMGIAPYLFDGPLWIQQTDRNCVDHWWTNLLYINNLAYRNEECIGWTWYLAVDTQLFLVAPLPLLCFFWRPLAGWLCTLAFVAIGVAMNSYISYDDGLTAAPVSGFYSLNMTVFQQQLHSWETNFFANLYILPWCRCAAWIIGLSLGCSMNRMPAAFSNAKLQPVVIRNLVAFLGWTLSTVIGLCIVYGLWPVYYDFYMLPQWVSSLYWAGSRTAWGVVISWIIYVCVSGVYGSRPVRAFLAYPGMIVLSRLSYAAYLIHPVVLSCFYMSARNPIHFTGPVFAFFYCGTLLLTFAVSFLITVAVEMPFANLDTFVLPIRMRD